MFSVETRRQILWACCLLMDTDPLRMSSLTQAWAGPFARAGTSHLPLVSLQHWAHRRVAQSLSAFLGRFRVSTSVRVRSNALVRSFKVQIDYNMRRNLQEIPENKIIKQARFWQKRVDREFNEKPFAAPQFFSCAFWKINEVRDWPV